MAKKTEGPGTVWVARAKCYAADGRLLGTCIDTPNGIAKAMMERSDIAYVRPVGEDNKPRSAYESRMADWNAAPSGFVAASE